MSHFPLPLYLASAALAYLMWRALSASKDAWGLPAAAVLATAAVWYVGDALYNDYEEFSSLIGPAYITIACWQLLLFVVAFGLMVEFVHFQINRKLLRMGSFAVHAYKTNALNRKSSQRQIDQITWAIAIVWLIVMGFGLARVEGDVLGLFAPYLAGEKAEPWARGRIGEGIDGLLSLAGYIQILLTSSLGVIFALSRNPRTRMLAGILFLLSAPYYIFDRTRNTMLAALLPAILAWVLLRVKANFVVKAAFLGIAFLGVNAWFSFVIANRTDLGIANAFSEGSGQSGKDAKHDGLNMLEELGWMNSFFAKGTFRPNWGERYFADLVNPIPRSIWANKPTIGFDYALARGMGAAQASNKEGGLAASVATGMIGQGVANFGGFLGPIATAFLMSLWVSLLARQDLLGWKDPVRLLIYGNGLVLTFNMGRDITLLIIYPFLFGLLFLWIWKYLHKTFFAEDPAAIKPRSGAKKVGGASRIHPRRRTRGDESGSRRPRPSVRASQ